MIEVVVMGLAVVFAAMIVAAFVGRAPLPPFANRALAGPGDTGP